MNLLDLIQSCDVISNVLRYLKSGFEAYEEDSSGVRDRGVTSSHRKQGPVDSEHGSDDHDEKSFCDSKLVELYSINLVLKIESRSCDAAIVVTILPMRQHEREY
uniref:SFRICE_021944 n=1 Tax=Spodoptera frugiperda TaxID=7108 RepID=A0A2H1W062_SPOFR